MTAEAIAERYGTITGKVAKMIESGEADRLIEEGKAETHKYALSRRPREFIVTEYLVQGEPYKIATWERKFFNPIPDIKDEAVTLIRYGFSEEEVEDALKITSREEIGVMLKCLREESHERDNEDSACRSYRSSHGYLYRSGGGRTLPAGLLHGCSSGIYIFTGNGRPLYLSGHVTSGWFDRLGGPPPWRFYNEKLEPLLRELAAKHGRSIRD